jgi:DNA-binding ferritin-like protein (Dps family)
MAKKKLKELTEREENFIQDILSGLDIVDAYKRGWENTYKDSKCRYEAKKILEKELVQARMQALILERQTDVLLDERFVIDMLKKTAIEKFGTAAGVRALELLGKKLAMFTDKQIIDDTKSYREQADAAWEDHLKRQAAKEGADIVEFKEKDGTNGS